MMHEPSAENTLSAPPDDRADTEGALKNSRPLGDKERAFALEDIG